MHRSVDLLYMICALHLAFKCRVSVCIFSLFQASSHFQTTDIDGPRQPVADLRPAPNSTRTPTHATHNYSPSRAEEVSTRTNVTPSEQRALDAEKRAAWREARMKELEEDAMKAQVVIAQVKAMSASSLEGNSHSDEDRKVSSPKKTINNSARLSPALVKR